MLRSLYSGVSGLQVHQTKMDVIGNNISNVNTIGFKSSSANFSDILYQTSQSASGANDLNGGKNAMQVGLGSSVASISSTVTKQGGAQRTDNALDVMITGSAFFIVRNNGTNYFTKNGAFTLDSNGNLCTSDGALVMGWQVDKTTETVSSGEVAPLRIYASDNLTTEPEATSEVYFSGNIDETDEELESATGKSVQMEFLDSLGNKYTAKYKVKKTETDGIYSMKLSDIVDEKGDSIFLTKNEKDGTTMYSIKDGMTVTFGGVKYKCQPKQGVTLTENASSSKKDFELIVEETETATTTLNFNSSTGKFLSVAGKETEDDSTTLDLTVSDDNRKDLFKNITIDYSKMTMYQSGGISNMTSARGNVETGLNAGSVSGKLTGVSISNNGEIYGSYDSGKTVLLGQIAVANFTNPAGLEAVGNGLYSATLNSGEFDGVGVDITTTGGKFTTGVLEMSNVDLSSEFTNMITAQRGFQSNSRIITTSDTLIEELLNLKR